MKMHKKLSNENIDPVFCVNLSTSNAHVILAYTRVGLVYERSQLVDYIDEQ